VNSGQGAVGFQLSAIRARPGRIPSTFLLEINPRSEAPLNPRPWAHGRQAANVRQGDFSLQILIDERLGDFVSTEIGVPVNYRLAVESQV